MRNKTGEDLGHNKGFSLEEEIAGLPEVMSVLAAASVLSISPDALIGVLEKEGFIVPGKRVLLCTRDIFAALKVQDVKSEVAWRAYIDSDVLI